MLHIPQGPSITGTSPSDCLVLYPGHSSGGGGVLPLYRGAVRVFYSHSQLGKYGFSNLLETYIIYYRKDKLLWNDLCKMSHWLFTAMSSDNDQFWLRINLLQMLQTFKLKSQELRSNPASQVLVWSWSIQFSMCV